MGGGEERYTNSDLISLQNVNINACVEGVEVLGRNRVDYSLMHGLLQNLTAYLQTLVKLEQAVRVKTFEDKICYPAFTDVFPNAFGGMVGNDGLKYCEVDASWVGVLCFQMFGLSGLLFQSRIQEVQDKGLVLDSSAWEELQSCCNIINYILHPNCPFMNEENLSRLGMEVFQRQSMSEWVSSQDKQIEVPTTMTASYFRKLLIDTFALHGGMDSFVAVCQAPEAFGVSGCDMVLNSLSFIYPVLTISGKDRVANNISQGVVIFLEKQFEDKNLNEVFKGSKNSYSSLCGLLRSLYLFVSVLSTPRDDLKAKVTGFQRHVILCLLESGTMSQQLHAVREIDTLIRQLREIKTTAANGVRPGLNDFLEPEMAWMHADDLASKLLASNLHQAQYIEDVLIVVKIFMRHGWITDAHLDYLWKFVESDETFEEIKSHVSQLLGTLAPMMSSKQREALFQKLENMGTCAASAKTLCEMLQHIALSDKNGALMEQVIKTAFQLALETSKSNLEQFQRLVIDLCQKYAGMETFMEILMEIVFRCLNLVNNTSVKDMIPPLAILNMIFVGEKIPNDTIQNLYKSINTDSKFVFSMTESFVSFLDKLNMEGRSPQPYLCESDRTCSKVLDLYYSLLIKMLNDGNYYVSKDQMQTILGWADRSPQGSKVFNMAWDILKSLVVGEKAVERVALEAFVQKYILDISFSKITASAWQCITAHIAALSNWEMSLPKIQTSYCAYIFVSASNAGDELWELVLHLLSDMVTFTTEETCIEASTLLARLMAELVHINGETTGSKVHDHIHTIKTTIKQSTEVLFGDSFDGPWYKIPELINNTRFQVTRLERIINHLIQMIDSFSNGCTPSERSAEGSFTDDLIHYQVIFQQISSKNCASEGCDIPRKQRSVRCPRNARVGDLRQLLAAEATDIAGKAILADQIRIFTAGREVISNHHMLHREGVVSPLMIIYSKDRLMERKDFEMLKKLQDSLIHDKKFLSMLLSLAEYFGLQNPTQGGSLGSAVELLLLLPLSEVVYNDLLDILNRDDLESRMSSWIMSQSSAGVSCSVLLYCSIVLCRIVSPFQVESVANKNNSRLDEEECGRFVRAFMVLCEGYEILPSAKAKASVSRFMMLLAKSLSSQIEKSNSDKSLKVIAEFALDLLSDLVGQSHDAHGDTSELLCREGMLVFFKLEELEDRHVTKVIDILRKMAEHQNESIRSLACQSILSLARRSPSRRQVIFDHLIKPVLLQDSCSYEKLNLCSEFVNLKGHEMTSELSIIADKVIACIQGKLTNRSHLAFLPSSLEILLKCCQPSDIENTSSLLRDLLHNYLFPELHVDLSDDEDIHRKYPKLLGVCYYVEREKNNLYCILRSLIFAREEWWHCWYQASHALIAMADKNFPKPFGNEVLEKLREEGHYCGLSNGGATCYMNATFQQIFMHPTLREKILSSPLPSSAETSEVFEAVRNIFLQLSAGVSPAADPSEFWNVFKDYEGNPVDVREHEDAYEFFTRLQDSIDEYLKSIGHEKVIYSVMGGAFNQVIEVPGHDKLRSEREEEFYQISLDVRGKKNLYESLDSYVAPEMLDGQNQWYCEELGKKVDARKRTLIKKLPQALVFHFKRFEWDFDTLSRWKIKDRFEFPQNLNMEAYLDPLSKTENSNEYELSGMIVHSGSAFAGHYYSFAKERGSNNWYCFDDTSVEPWDISKIDAECFGGIFTPEGSERTYERQNSAYIVVYERVEGLKSIDKGHINPMQLIQYAPSTLQTLQICDNIKQINLMHVLSEQMKSVYEVSVKEMQLAVDGPRPAKKLPHTSNVSDSHKTLNDENIFRSPERKQCGHAILIEQRDDATVQCLHLCLEYICLVLVRGMYVMKKDSAEVTPDRVENMLHTLKNACGSANRSLDVLRYFGSSNLAFEAISSPCSAVKNGLRNLFASSFLLAESAVTPQEYKVWCQKLAVALIEMTDTNMRMYPTAIVRWETLLGCISEMCVSIVGRQALAQYTEEIFSWSGHIFDVLKQMEKQQRCLHEFRDSYAFIIQVLLQMCQLPDNSSQKASQIYKNNPFSIDKKERKLPLDSLELPENALSLVDLSSGSSILCTLIPPGSFISQSNSDFLKWFMWESEERTYIGVMALLEHIFEDQVLFAEFASEVWWLADAISLQDGLSGYRIRIFLTGTNTESSAESSNESDLEDVSSGLFCLSKESENIIQCYLYVSLAIQILQNNEEGWQQASDETRQDGDSFFLQWLKWAWEISSHFSDQLDEDAQLRIRWKNILPSNDESLSEFFRPEATMQRIWPFVAHTVNSDDLKDKENKSADVISDIRTEDGAKESLNVRGMVCITATCDEEGSDNDDVAEIDVDEDECD